MKRLAAILVAAPLVGCGPSFPTIDGQALAEAVAQVREHTQKICNYFPTNDSVVGILTAANPILESAYNIAKQICDAVTEAVPPLNPVQMGQPRLGDETQCPMVRGVCIEGRFGSSQNGMPGPEIHPPKPPETSPMSKELDERIDASRKKLIETANVTVGMGNYKQIKRSFEEILLELHNVIDAINAEEGDK